ncbi:rod-binding protein [Alkalithermobacter paradoxus]|uniref:Flagellar rod assembly protein/muramidase FlgJ n=1 Tax=Alkalithermobacter paradoxus TaxID=29349 RepID=A0A1V4I7X3_9FIRM|nr:flagellar rod assembly protein/muramidase FlgJ [[Clostridium] thermoalcaliphilum]
MQINNTNLDRITTNIDTKDKDKLMHACKLLEKEFTKIMFKEMKKTVPESSMNEKSHGRKIFEELYDDELIQSTTQSSQLGLAKLIYDQFTKTNIKR